MRLVVFICVLIIGTVSADAFSITKGFNGGSVTCTSDTIRSYAPREPRRSKIHGGERIVGEAEVVDKVGTSHQYTFTITTIDTVVRKLGGIRKSLSFTAWDFVCRVNADHGVTHTCNVKNTSGNCVVCSNERCSRVTYNVQRK